MIELDEHRGMLEQLLTEQVNPASDGIDALATMEMLRIINEEDAKVAAAVALEIPNIARAVEAVVEVVRSGGRIYYLGAGTSGRLGVLDAAECPPTFNVSPDLFVGIMAGGEKALARASEANEDDRTLGARDLSAAGFGAGDLLIAIAASGRTPYVLGAVEAARKLGAATVGLSCTPDSDLSGATQIAITPLVGPEIIAGSTRMKAGTATKLVLNMLSTGAMIRLGYVHGNLMVNVQPKNEKLRDRARRIIMQAASVSSAEAQRLLEAADNNVKNAIVMGRLRIPLEEAKRRLARAGGRISEALQSAEHG
jgi:N-acetylmuramic acid 6-phosphate etherase